MSELLTPADRAELERLNTDNMPDRAQVVRDPAILGTGSAGGTKTLTPTQVYAAEPCRLAPATNLREQPVGEQVTALALRRVSFAKDRDLKVRDRLVVTQGTLSAAGVWSSRGITLSLEVVGLEQPHSYDVALVALCKIAGTP